MRMSRGTECALADADLVARYAASRAPADFAEIVARHGPMVLRVCHRLTGNAADAEDAAQAAFLVLAQKPGAVAHNLAGWLLKVARDCACRVIRARARRARREEASAHMKASLPTRDVSELREEIDAALVQLPASLREAVVLRYLEGRDGEEAARVAGCNEATLRWRSMKGLERLRGILARRHGVFSVGVLAAFLAKEAATTVPAAKLVAWAGTVVAGSAATGTAAAIAQGVLNTMFWAKVKVCALVTAGAAVVAGATAPLVLRSEEPAKPAPTVRAAVNPVQLGVNGSLGGRRPFPDDNPWNQDISREPVDPNSAALIASIGTNKPLKASFGTFYDGAPMGIPYMVVAGHQPRVPLQLDEPAESDPGPYPLPADGPLPAPFQGKDDLPLLVLDRDNWKLYELGTPAFVRPGWRGGVGAVFDLNTGQDRPARWTSACGSGLPIFPGLIRYDEVVEQQEIRHALRFTVRQTRRAYVAPARHWASKRTDPDLPPMGMRVRLRPDFDMTGFPASVQVILRALQRYGMFVAEHGTDWYLSGTHDPRWNNKELKSLEKLRGRDFEVVRMKEIVTP
jgi:RNA polymerase sigma factor (sigma-70 family)